MREVLLSLLNKSILGARNSGLLNGTGMPRILLEIPKYARQGDFATTCALSLAKIEKKPPREIASILISQLEGMSPFIEKIEMAGPGYINFFLADEYWHQGLLDIHRENDRYGFSNIGNNRKIQIEFVSANPTGPLHVAHGRAAALGDAVSRLLEAIGYKVDREYYMNDIGAQMDLLGRSTYLRYRSLFGEAVNLPEGSYKGDYISEIAASAKASEGDRYLTGSEATAVSFFKTYSYEMILGWIQKDLRQFGVRFNKWFSEKKLHQRKEVDAIFTILKSKGILYEKGDARWVRTTDYGDDKDRVVVRSNGEHTYFASDIAYHRNKFERGYDRLINIWGADHHGYINRIKAVAEAMGYASDRLTILTHQLVNLLRDGKPVRMSKRSGAFVTLREVLDEVGVDATRFFFLMRRSDSPLDFDLELAKKASNENPVYYVQYAHARLCSIVRVAEENGWAVKEVVENAQTTDLRPLSLSEETTLIKQLMIFPSLVRSSAESLEPHRLTAYLQTLAGMLHKYYFGCRVVTEDASLTKARLILVAGIRIVLKRGLDLLGIQSPERM
ncbi:MAG: arginine--tRNA ligase [Nitrospiria bacterium]